MLPFFHKRRPPSKQERGSYQHEAGMKLGIVGLSTFRFKAFGLNTRASCTFSWLPAFAISNGSRHQKIGWQSFALQGNGDLQNLFQTLGSALEQTLFVCLYVLRAVFGGQSKVPAAGPLGISQKPGFPFLSWDTKKDT